MALDAAFATYRQVARRTPKKDGLVLFGARRGLWYMDNSKRVYEWILENRPGLRPVWMTRNRDVARELKAKGLPVCHTSSPKAFYLLARAPLAVTSTQLYDITSIPELPPDNLRIVFLGHGKSIKASSLSKKGPRSDWTRWLFQRKSELIDVGISTSPFISALAAKSNGVPVERFRETGYPVNDQLLDPSPQAKARFDEYLGGLQPDKVVLYAPTWRPAWRDGLESTRFFPFDDYDETALVDHLEANRTLLLLRPHEIDLLKCRPLRDFLHGLAAKSDWIRVCDPHAFSDVNEVLPFTDLLVSDYSSIYHDYLLLDRPMVFIPYDHDQFEKVIGFMFDYYDHLPGPAVDSQEGFLARLQEAFRGEDTHKQRRHALRSMIHTHTDAQATQRVVEVITTRLNGHNGKNGHHGQNAGAIP